MLKVGFIDYYLDEWHANYYPEYMRAVISKYNYDAEITFAHAACDRDGGISTEQWCAKNNIKKASTQDKLIGECDAIFVLAPDNSMWHEELCRLPLQSKKPVYVDKTFAPDVATATRMFELAEKYGTPVFSSSALRYAQSILDYTRENYGKTKFMSTNGPHEMHIYAVHQLDPINAVMGTGIKRLKCFSMGKITQLILDYCDGRMANLVQTPNPYAEFWFMVSDGENGKRLDTGDYYHNFMKAVLDFYITKELPVKRVDTMEVISVIEAAKYAREHNDEWVLLD